MNFYSTVSEKIRGSIILLGINQELNEISFSYTAYTDQQLGPEPEPTADHQLGWPAPTAGRQLGGPAPTAGQQLGGPEITADQQLGGPEITADQQLGGPAPTAGGQQLGAPAPTAGGQQLGGPAPAAIRQLGGPEPTADQQLGGPAPTAGGQQLGGPEITADQQLGGPAPTAGQQQGGPKPPVYIMKEAALLEPSRGIKRKSTENSSEHTCVICLKSFSTRVGLLRHGKRHGVTAKTYVCKLCTFTHTMKKELREHMATHSKKLVCQICLDTFDTVARLNWHESMHDIVGLPHACTQCGHRFKQFSNLKRHIRAHDDVRRFQCGMCDSKFAQLSNLHVHIRGRHRHSGD